MGWRDFARFVFVPSFGWFVCTLLVIGEAISSGFALFLMLCAASIAAIFFAWQKIPYGLSLIGGLWFPLLIPKRFYWGMDAYSPEGGAFEFLRWVGLDFGFASRACLALCMAACFSVVWLYARLERSYHDKHGTTFIPWDKISGGDE